ncbi:MAG TPA: hypothetical protein VF523_15590 [Burkholderiales bacterium]
MIRSRALVAALVMCAASVVSDAAASSRAAAQDRMPDSAFALDSRVVQVVSGGSWTKGDSSGQYRIIVRSDGIDTVHYTTVVQWMVRRGLGQELTLVHSVDVRTVAKRWFYMLDPELRLRGDRWLLIVNAAEAPLRTASHRPQFVLGPPGQIRPR